MRLHARVERKRGRDRERQRKRDGGGKEGGREGERERGREGGREGGRQARSHLVACHKSLGDYKRLNVSALTVSAKACKKKS